MKQKTHGPIQYAVMFVFSAFLFFCSGVFFHSAVTQLPNVHDFSSALVSLSVFLAGGSVFGAAYYLARSLITVRKVSEEGLSLSRHGRIVLFIRWEEIAEVGIGKAPTPRGDIRKLYFSTRPLTADEKNDLNKAQKCSFYFSHLNAEWLSYLKSHSPLALPEEAGEFLSAKPRF